MRLQQREAHRLARRVGQEFAHGQHIAERFRHLVAFHDQVAVVHPVAHEGGPVGADALGQLVLVVREDQVRPAAVDVEGLAQIGARHGRAFDMPAGPAPAPGARPAGQVFRARLPEHEVRRVPLVGRHIDARAGDQLLPGVAREPPVIRHGGHMEEHMPVRLIGVAVRDQLFDHLDHFADMPGGARLDIGRQRAERGHVGVERLGRPRRDALDRLARLGRPRIYLVVHVRDVAHIGHARIEPLQQPVEHVEHDDGARIADMREVVNRRPAHIEAHMLRVERLERLLGARQRVVDDQGHRTVSVSMRSCRFGSGI